MQGIFPLNVGGGGVRLTTAKFYGPSGVTISQRGVTPTIPVQTVARPGDGPVPGGTTDDILRAGLEVARASAARVAPTVTAR